jgi:hypothetical protein
MPPDEPRRCIPAPQGQHKAPAISLRHVSRALLGRDGWAAWRHGWWVEAGMIATATRLVEGVLRPHDRVGRGDRGGGAGADFPWRRSRCTSQRVPSWHCPGA